MSSFQRLATLSAVVGALAIMTFVVGVWRYGHPQNPLTFYLAVVTAATPLYIVGAFLVRRVLTPLRVGALLLVLVGLVNSSTQFWLLLLGRPTQVVSYSDALLSVLVYLPALAAVLVTRWERTAFIGATIVFFLAWTIDLLWNFEPVRGASRVQSLHALVLLFASLWTFLRLAMTNPPGVPLFRHDWGWILGGVILYSATAVLYVPALSLIPSDRNDLMRQVANMRFGVMVVSYLAIGIGMTHPAMLRRESHQAG